MAPASTAWRDKLTSSGSTPLHSLQEHSVWWLRTCGVAYAVFAVLFYVFTPGFIGDHKYRVLFWTCVPWCVLTYTWPLITARYQRQKERLVLGAILLATAVFLTLTISSYFSCWCCKREVDMVEMCEMSLEATKILERNKIDYWICFGTLLGGLRESDMPFQSMAWEHDFDLCILEKDWPRIEQLWEEELKNYVHPPGSTNLYDPRFRAVVSRTYMDIYRFRESASGTHLETTDGVGEGKVYSVAKSDVYPLQRMKVCEFDFYAPSNPEQNIENLFGKSWRTPMWPPGIQSFACKLWVDCTLKRYPQQ